jgi:biotin carboxyl carrier protein
MKLKADIFGNEHDVVVDLSNDRFAVDDRQYNIEVRELSGGEYLLQHDDNVYKCRVEAKHGTSVGTGAFAVSVRGNNYDVTLVDPKRLRSGEGSAAHHSGAAEIVSTMPGKIVRVLVEVGATVAAGDGVIVVEAMKMQNEMKAPKAGVVVSINAAEGATVSAGDVLAVIE